MFRKTLLTVVTSVGLLAGTAAVAPAAEARPFDRDRDEHRDHDRGRDRDWDHDRDHDRGYDHDYRVYYRCDCYSPWRCAGEFDSYRAADFRADRLRDRGFEVFIR